MSSTNRGAKREPSDFYPTPAWCVDRLLERIALDGTCFLDPCAGDGALIRAAQPFTHGHWHAIEVRPECSRPLVTAVQTMYRITDYLAMPPEAQTYDAILTNPPYTHAQAFIERALLDAPIVAMLLRLNFLGSAERVDFWRKHPADVYVLPNRPSFVKGTTDSCEYGWFVWGHAGTGPGRHYLLNPTPLAERKRGAV